MHMLNFRPVLVIVLAAEGKTGLLLGAFIIGLLKLDFQPRVGSKLI